MVDVVTKTNRIHPPRATDKKWLYFARRLNIAAFANIDDRSMMPIDFYYLGNTLGKKAPRLRTAYCVL